MTGGTDELRLSIAWFETAKPNGPAPGNSETTTWSNFASIFATWRREGEKGGLNFVPSRFEMEADGRHVRRQLANVIARTAVALDIETNGKTGEYHHHRRWPPPGSKHSDTPRCSTPVTTTKRRPCVIASSSCSIRKSNQTSPRPFSRPRA